MKKKEFEDFVNNLPVVVESEHKFKIKGRSINFVWMYCENCIQNIKVSLETTEIDREIHVCKKNFDDIL